MPEGGANFQIISNNPLVRDKYPDVTKFCYGQVEDVFRQVRDGVHCGCRLISHPLSGSIKPNQSPYKSVVLSQPGGELDFFSLQLIESAFSVLKKLASAYTIGDSRILADFQTIDLDLLDSAMQSLPAEFHQ